MPKKFFTPTTLLAPKLGTTVQEYTAYLACYDMYAKELGARKSEWKAQVKAGKLAEKQALAAKKVSIKVWETRDVPTKYEIVNEKPVEVTLREAKVSMITAPLPATPVVKIPADVKKQRKAAKRKRYAANLKLRKLKELATESKWEARIHRNMRVVQSSQVLSKHHKGKPKKGPGKPGKKKGEGKPPTPPHKSDGTGYESSDYGDLTTTSHSTAQMPTDRRGRAAMYLASHAAEAGDDGDVKLGF